MYGQGNLFRSTRRLRAEFKVHSGCRGTACRTGTWRSITDESSASSFERYIRRSRAGNQYTRSQELRASDSEFQGREDGHGKHHLEWFVVADGRLSVHWRNRDPNMARH